MSEFKKNLLGALDAGYVPSEIVEIDAWDDDAPVNTEEGFKSYCAKLLKDMDAGDLDELADPIEVETDEKGDVSEILLQYGGPTLYLKKDGNGWTLNGSFGSCDICESLSDSAEYFLNDWIARSISDYDMYYK